MEKKSDKLQGEGLLFSKFLSAICPAPKGNDSLSDLLTDKE